MKMPCSQVSTTRQVLIHGKSVASKFDSVVPACLREIRLYQHLQPTALPFVGCSVSCALRSVDRSAFCLVFEIPSWADARQAAFGRLFDNLHTFLADERIFRRLIGSSRPTYILRTAHTAVIIDIIVIRVVCWMIKLKMTVTSGKAGFAGVKSSKKSSPSTTTASPVLRCRRAILLRTAVAHRSYAIRCSTFLR